MMNKLYNLLKFFLILKYVNSSQEGFIIDGEYTTIQSYPHQVFLDIVCQNELICGGSIINQDIVLSAAHCFENYEENKNNRVLVKYGSQNIYTMKSSVMKTLRIHPDYNIKTMFADIALVICKTPISLGKLVQKVAIMEEPPPNKICYVSGWGAINDNMELPDYLKHAKQRIQTEAACKMLNTPKGAFCAGPVKDPEGHPAIGDSGGALVVDKYIQIGIVSYKVRSKPLVVYTNVSYYFDWIRENAANLYCFSE